MIDECDPIPTGQKGLLPVPPISMDVTDAGVGIMRNGLLSVIVPCYNEEDRIYENLKECVKSLSELGRPFEIIAVNDGSTDNTAQELMRLAALHDKIVPVTYSRNVGKGNALRAGAMRARGSLILFMDADLEIHPKHAADFIKILESTGADMVIGSKRHPMSRVDYPLKRRVLSYGYHIMLCTLFDLRVSDTQLGFKMAKRVVIEKEMAKSMVNRYAFDLELLVNTEADGFKIVEAPIELDFSRPLSGRIGLKSVTSIFKETVGIYARRRRNRSRSAKNTANKNIHPNLKTSSDQDFPSPQDYQ